MPSRTSTSRSSGRSGETWSRRSGGASSSGRSAELERQQPVALVRPAARAVEARVDDEPPQAPAAARAGDRGLPASTSAIDVAGESRRERVEAAWHERPAAPSAAGAGRRPAIAASVTAATSVSILTRLCASQRRPRLLVFNQYYWPGVEATAHLLTELCEALGDRLRRDGDHGSAARVRARPGLRGPERRRDHPGALDRLRPHRGCTGARSTTSRTSRALSGADCSMSIDPTSCSA